MPDQFPKKITENSILPFSIDKFGLYSITITARCKSADQDLRVEIDNIKLREMPPNSKPQYNNIPSAWNGTQLKGLAKTVTFILQLNKGNHSLVFIPNKEAIIEKYNISPITNPQDIQFNLEIQAEDGDRRPWFTYALINLPLKNIAAEVSTKWHFLDGDDVKLIVDGQIKQNNKSILHKNWIWSASILNKFFGRKRESQIFTENLSSGMHYIEFWADKSPILHSAKLDLGEISSKRSPTVDDPKWTGDFSDDTDQMILARAIFGEARSNNFPDKAKIAVGWSIRNRVENEGTKLKTYQEVITKQKQYSAFNKNDDNRLYVANPLWKNNEIDRISWYNCYDIAGKVTNGEIIDPTKGANHYYDNSISAPYWATPKTLVLTIYSSDNNHALIFHKL